MIGGDCIRAEVWCLTVNTRVWKMAVARAGEFKLNDGKKVDLCCKTNLIELSVSTQDNSITSNRNECLMASGILCNKQ